VGEESMNGLVTIAGAIVVLAAALNPIQSDAIAYLGFGIMVVSVMLP